jgi:hypothetical protein
VHLLVEHFETASPVQGFLVEMIAPELFPQNELPACLLWDSEVIFTAHAAIHDTVSVISKEKTPFMASTALKKHKKYPIRFPGKTSIRFWKNMRLFFVPQSVNSKRVFIGPSCKQNMPPTLFFRTEKPFHIPLNRITLPCF